MPWISTSGGSVSGTSATSVTITRGTGTGQLDCLDTNLLVAQVTGIGTGTCATPTGWTLLGNNAGGAYIKEYIFVRLADTATSYTFNNTAGGLDVTVVAYGGFTTPVAGDLTMSTTGSVTATVTGANTWVVSGCAYASTALTTAPTGTDTSRDTRTANYSSIHGNSRFQDTNGVVATGSTTKSFTFTSNVTSQSSWFLQLRFSNIISDLSAVDVTVDAPAVVSVNIVNINPVDIAVETPNVISVKTVDVNPVDISVQTLTSDVYRVKDVSPVDITTTAAPSDVVRLTDLSTAVDITTSPADITSYRVREVAPVDILVEPLESTISSGVAPVDISAIPNDVIVERTVNVGIVDITVDTLQADIFKVSDLTAVDITAEVLIADVYREREVELVDISVEVLPASPDVFLDAVDIFIESPDPVIIRITDLDIVETLDEVLPISVDVILDAVDISTTPLTADVYRIFDAIPVDIDVEVATSNVIRILDVPPLDILVEALLTSVGAFDNRPITVKVEALDIDVGFSAEDIYYRPLDIPEDVTLPSRVIAQLIRTKEWISWDLPVDGLTYEKTLSGACVISGEFTIETDEVRDLNLIPYGTWIYVEENGVIRAGGILQPMDLDTGEKLSFEAVGFSAYPNGIPYLSDIATQIQIDPLSVVRNIWNHIQSYSDGNLGVVIRGTTPVRIGKPKPIVPDPRPVDWEPDPTTENDKPYELHWYDGPDCGEEISKLCQENNIEFRERSTWSSDKTSIGHFLDFYYPRIGIRQENLRFAEGENILNAIGPEELSDAYANTVIVYGSGEGSTVIRGYASQPHPTKIRKVKIITDGTIQSQARANAIAKFELAKAQATLDITEIVIDALHENAPHGSFAEGDEIFITTSDLPWFGKQGQWERILSYLYDPDQETITLRLRRAESFYYA